MSDRENPETSDIPEIIVYYTPFCRPCVALKQFLTDQGVTFVNKDLMMDEEAAELMESHNIRSSPVLGVGDEFYGGKVLERENLVNVLKL